METHILPINNASVEGLMTKKVITKLSLISKRGFNYTTLRINLATKSDYLWCGLAGTNKIKLLIQFESKELIKTEAKEIIRVIESFQKLN